MATIYDRNIYRNGEVVKKAYRDGELIYQKVNAPEPVPPTPVYSAMPLTFEILSGGYLKWGAVDQANTATTLEYEVNDSGTWNVLSASSMNDSDNRGRIEVATGDIIRFRGNGATTYRGLSFAKGTTATYKVYGNIMSLLEPQNYASLTSYTFNGPWVFSYMFGIQGTHSGIIDASGLYLPFTGPYTYMRLFEGAINLTAAPSVLPATTLGQYCYNNMFQDCTSLTQAPVLPATTLAEGCYYYMFKGCTNLNYIKCLATDNSAYNCTYNWVSQVAASGTFVKDATMSSWTTGANGIPSGWTVQDYNPNPQPSGNPVLVVNTDNQGGLFSTDQSGYYDPNDEQYYLPPAISNNGVYTWSFSANPEEGLTIAYLFGDSADIFSEVTASTFTNTRVYLDAYDGEVYSEVNQSETNYEIYPAQVDTPSWDPNNENTDLAGGYYGATVVYDTTDESVEFTWSAKEYWHMDNESDCLDLGGCWDEGQGGCFRCAETEEEPGE